MIADANGLMGDETLSAGQVLTIPNKVHNSHNTSDVFRVYDPNEAIGNNSPTAPKPQKHHSGGCGGIGQIPRGGRRHCGRRSFLPEISPFFSTTFGQVLAGRDRQRGRSRRRRGDRRRVSKFDWGAVAMAAVSAGVSAGLGEVIQGADIGSQFLRGALGSAITQGIGVATGLQKQFDWAGVAAAGVSSGVSAAVGGGPAGAFIGDVFGAATRSVITGTDFGDNLLAVLPSAIGSTIGNAVAGSIASSIDNNLEFTGHSVGGPQEGLASYTSSALGAPPSAGIPKPVQTYNKFTATKDAVVAIPTASGDIHVLSKGGDPETIASVVRTLPSGVLEYLVTHHIQFAATAASVAEFDPSLATKHPPGWPVGTTYADVPGTFLAAGKGGTVVISTGILGAQGSINEVFHELAHGIDYVMQFDHGSHGMIGSTQSAFSAAYQKVLPTLTIDYNDKNGKFNYFNAQNIGHGASETFAESFAAFFQSQVPAGTINPSWNTNWNPGLGSSILDGRPELSAYWKNWSLALTKPNAGH